MSVCCLYFVPYCASFLTLSLLLLTATPAEKPRWTVLLSVTCWLCKGRIK